MAIGGPWSPSLDGPDPESDPSVLVKTAIRTCKALSGIDLSSCTQWHKFLEINYRRQETNTKPARTETTVIFLPDVWSVVPTTEEFPNLEKLYAEALNRKLNPEPTKPKEPEIVEEKPQQEEEKVEAETVEPETAAADKTEKPVEEEVQDNENKTEETEAVQEEVEEETQKPTPWSEIDVKNMKVNDLRGELVARGMNSKGLKSQLVGRLQKAVKEEQEQEEAKQENGNVEEEEPNKEEETLAEDKADSMEVVDEVKEDDEVQEIVQEKEKKAEEEAFAKPKPIDEKLKQIWTKAYRFPTSPCILVHPNAKAKSGKFDCTTMSLSVLLDYRIDDNKEGTFEVSLFAELFNEMLMRDAGFKIYKTVSSAPSLAEKKEKQENGKKEEPKEESKEDVVVLDDDSKDSKDSVSSKKPEKKKMVTIDKELLMACSYYDQGHCGYFETKDLEDILFIMNLNLSRAQIKKLVSKVVSSKDQISYRVFTDKAEDEAIKAAETTEVDLEKIGLGFKAFVPGAQSENADSNKEGICSYRGSVVDVQQLLAQLERSERARSETENRLNEITKNLKEVKDTSDRYLSSKEKLQSEVKELKKKLRGAEDDFKKSQTDTSKYYTTLKDIFAQVAPIVQIKEKPDKSENEEETEAVATSSEDVATKAEAAAANEAVKMEN